MYPQVNEHVSKWKLLEPAWTLTSHRTKKTLRIDDIYIYELSSQKVEIQVPNMLGYYMYLHLEEEAKVFVFNHVMT